MKEERVVVIFGMRVRGSLDPAAVAVAELLADLRARKGYAKPMIAIEDGPAAIAKTKDDLIAVDDLIAPLAVEARQLQNEAWGPMMQAKQDKGSFARQIERYADIYTSRVSNLLFPGPYATFRMGRHDLPHDPHA